MSFSDFFANIYGERWPQILEKLKSDERQVRRLNLFSQKKPNDNIVGLPSCVWHDQREEIPRDQDGLLKYYVQDPASVVVAEALTVQPGEKVLDMCAAPGGKSLILAQNLFGGENSESELSLNEPSAGRRERLIKVVQNYIPRSVRDKVWVIGKDGSVFGRKTPEFFDKILLDAPCSGERHLLANPEELAKWSKARTERLAQQQYSLLCSAIDALKVGGELVYSTCSISPFENDAVIDKFFKKRGSAIEVIPVEPELSGAEKTKWGNMFLPDKCGFGPMYFAKVRKLSSI